jgi:hypothetical protein
LILQYNKACQSNVLDTNLLAKLITLADYHIAFSAIYFI